MRKSSPNTTQSVTLRGINIDRVSMAEATAQISGCILEGYGTMIVTPNVDHMRLLRVDEKFRSIYAQATHVFCDSFPLSLLSRARLGSKGIGERVAGADLVPELLSNLSLSSTREIRIAVVGSSSPAIAKLEELFESNLPNLKLVYGYPGYVSTTPKEIASAIAEPLIKSKPDLLLVCLGAPKQEYFGILARELLPTTAILCVGAAVDFYTGTKKRAPIWVRRIGFEWLHRVFSEPGRLFKRYLVGFRELILLTFETWGSR